MKQINPKLVLYLGVLSSCFSALLVRQSEAPSLTIATLRLFWTMVILTPITVWRHWAEVRQTSLRDLVGCALSGIFLALHFTTWFESLKWTSVASSTVLGCTEVIFVSLGFALFLRGTIPKLGVVAIGLSFLGSMVLALNDGGSGGIGLRPIYGDMLAVLCAVLIAVYTLIGRVKRGTMSTTVYTFFTYLSCLLTLLVLDGVTATPVLGWPLREHLVAIGLAVLCTLLGHSLHSWSLKYISPSYVAAAKLCQPIFSSLIAIPMFSEFLSPVQIAGAGIILAGMLLYTYAEGKQAPDTQAAPMS